MPIGFEELKMTSTVITQRAFPRTWVVSVLLVVAAAALTALAAQWYIYLPFTPVPISGQTFAVLLTGAALGWKLGAAGQMLYLAIGALGAPVFTEGSSGMEVITGATGGYLIGFVFAAGLVGWMAEHRQDRTFATMFTAFILGSAVIYLFGVIGLMVSTGWGLAEAVEKGVVPFLLGDLIKAAMAGILLPGAWKLLGDR
ncbi:MAG TPA: biotin transporter BioY [Acidimicrobiia bacterium]|nr:biotin transporter BioY [Acidimicrobiia bacterium]